MALLIEKLNLLRGRFGTRFLHSEEAMQGLAPRNTYVETLPHQNRYLRENFRDEACGASIRGATLVHEVTPVVVIKAVALASTARS